MSNTRLIRRISADTFSLCPNRKLPFPEHSHGLLKLLYAGMLNATGALDASGTELEPGPVSTRDPFLGTTARLHGPVKFS